MTLDETTEIAIDRISHAYEDLEPESLDSLMSLYATNARFKDPFNEVVGVPAIKKIFADMFIKLNAPRFKITSKVVGNGEACLQWEFQFSTRGKAGRGMLIKGCTWLVISQDGLILNHRDYWDAAEELYEKIPFLGGLMRWLKKRIES